MSEASECVVGDLPAPFSSFVGRVQEMAEVSELLITARLVTLTGPPGVGKTRLALRVAADLAKDYSDGAWLVELASRTDPAGVPQAVASVLQVREQLGQPMTDTLVSHLRSRTMLLVLDNCEHLIGAAAKLADALLKTCPNLRILATSRESLNLTGEIAWPVPPLSVPPIVEKPRPEALLSYEAVSLFCDRAKATQPASTLTVAAAPAVGEICRRLEGIPLAIELAAARMGVLSPAQIAARLDDCFSLLSQGSRTAPSRHRTLLAALEWSHDLLPDAERVLLRRLSVFAGGCTLEAAEEVCAAGGIARNQVFDLLAQLAGKSLVLVESRGHSVRYRLLQTIRQYGRDRLADHGEEREVRTAHAVWCATMAEQAEPALSGASQAAWLERLEVERTNFQAALEWTLTERQTELSLRLAGALSLFWLTRGHLTEGRQWLRQVLLAGAAGPSSLRAKALWGFGLLSSLAGDFVSALTAGDESLTLAQQSGDTQGRARALHLLGTMRTIEDPALARPLLEESITLARESGDAWCLAGALTYLGWAETFQGNFAAGRAPLEEGVRVARYAQSEQGLQQGLLGLGYGALQMGEYARAEATLEGGLAVARALGDPFWTAVGIIYLGDLAGAEGDYAKARALMEEAVAFARATGSSALLGFALSFHGRVALEAGDVAGAHPLFEECLSLPRQMGHKGNIAIAFFGLGRVCHALGDSRAALAFLEESLVVARTSHDKLVIYQSLYELARFARSQGDYGRAKALHHEAMALQPELRHRPGAVLSLEALAGLAAEERHIEYAARLLGAAQSLRDRIGFVRSPADQPGYDADVTLVREGLSPDEFDTAWAAGAALSEDEALAYARRSRGPRRRPATGLASLTPTELEVVRLVSEGLTNPEIGERLFISRRTVQAHLSHVFAKLEISSRKELRSQPRPDPEPD
ncbi:MAG: helix-turn-helix transcriptional regulator [Egibacteraceae bacterium]